ncbi:uncharacterized protein LOC127282294 [Leptopilina boulardi]|uniref:uncharacterized protein LOC127282294 n=1 Tax=Leptopilina boulardi TaxID=63433 RepID=UPI0021F50BA2|nr:uncharacterized protein LOC127282294 [Leptopilina boulardi]
MVLVCAYCGQKDAEGVSFHIFPKRLELRQLWIKNMGFDDNFEITSNSRLCSDHFDEKCFTKTNDRERIHSESVPTIFSRYYLKCICCDNVKKTGCILPFRKFPFKNQYLLKVWIKNIGLKDFCPDERSLICDDHFEEHCFYKRKSGGLILKSNAFPNLFHTNISNDYICVNEVTQPDAADTSVEENSISETIMTGVLNNKRSSSLENLQNSKRLKLDVNEENSPVEATRILTEKRSCSVENLQNTKYVISDLQSSLESTPIPNNEKTPQIPTTPQKRNILNHDHHYHSSPRSLTRSYFRSLLT